MDEREITSALEGRSAAVRGRDLERLLSYYSPDVVYFDVVPPLRYRGSAALRGRFAEWFAGYEGGIRQDIHDLNVWINGDLAVASMLIRSGGTLTGGHEVGLWVRATSCFQQSNGACLITHEHVSVPADLKTGRAVVDIDP